jgi:hypothetical protein
MLRFAFRLEEPSVSASTRMATLGVADLPQPLRRDGVTGVQSENCFEFGTGVVY